MRMYLKASLCSFLFVWIYSACMVSLGYGEINIPNYFLIPIIIVILNSIIAFIIFVIRVKIIIDSRNGKNF